MSPGVKRARVVTGLTGAVVVALVGAACGGGAAPGDTPTFGQPPDRDGAEAEASPIDGEWRLIEWTEDEEQLARGSPAPMERIRMEISGTVIDGRGPCNAHRCRLEVDGSSIWIETYDWTDMGCPEDADEPFDADAPYFEALELIESYERDEDRLVLAGEGIRLVYEEDPPVRDVPLAGTQWVLHTTYEGPADDLDGAAADVAADGGDEPTLLLNHDGHFTAHTGCREVSGRWEQDGEQLRFDELDLGDAACPDAALEPVDEQQLRIFESRVSFEVEGRALRFSVDDLGGLGYAAETVSAEEG